MKAFFYLLALCLFAGSSRAQKLDDVREKIEKGKYEEAREKIDAVLANQVNHANADAWLYKAQVYAELGKQNLDARLAAAALEAIQKYVGLEKDKDEAKRFLMSRLQGHRTFFDVYSTNFKVGADAYNRQDYGAAFKGFVNAVTMFRMLKTYGMTDVSIDTTSILYAGVAAESAKLPEEAVNYYRQIADLKIRDTSHMGMYGYIINHYLGRKDIANATQYIERAEALFPGRDAWMLYRLDLAGPDTLARLQQYETLLKKYPDNRMLVNDYAVEMYRYVYYSDKRSGDTAWVNRLRNAYRGAARVNPTAVNLYVIHTILSDDLNFYLNSFNRIKSSTAAAHVAERTALQARIDQTSDEFLAYGKKAAAAYRAVPSLKESDKANYRRVLQNLVSEYNRRNRASEAAPYADTLKALN